MDEDRFVNMYFADVSYWAYTIVHEAIRTFYQNEARGANR
jgi:hypothetical protein